MKIVFRPYLREKYIDSRKVQAVMIRFHGARFIRCNACTLFEITGRQLNFLFTPMEKGRGGVKWERVEIGGILLGGYHPVPYSAVFATGALINL